MSGRALAEQIDALLPQTQCTKCGHTGCRPYAEAIAAGAAEINRCPPGGTEGIARLAAILGRNAVALDPGCGAEEPRAVALIDEARCIGCTLCIQACPVDAIVGAAKLMHTVIAELCTGCDLCLPPCPVDCITRVPVGDGTAPWTPAMAAAARARYEFRKLRLTREQEEASARLARKAREKPAQHLPDAKKATILAAVERARARTARCGPGNADHSPIRVRAPATATDTRRGAAKKR